MLENNENLNTEHVPETIKIPENSNLDYWKPVLSFYAKTTSWIVLPLLLGVLAGGYVGKSFGSQVLLFVFIMFGFLVTCFGIYREIKNYKKGLGIPSYKDILKKEEK